MDTEYAAAAVSVKLMPYWPCFIYVCMCVYMCIRTFVRMEGCMYVSVIYAVLARVYAQDLLALVWICECIRMYAHTCMHAYHVYVYVCVNAHIHASIHVYVYMYVCIRKCVYVCVFVLARACMCVCICVCACVCACMQVCMTNAVCVHVCRQASVRSNTYTNRQKCTRTDTQTNTDKRRAKNLIFVQILCILLDFESRRHKKAR